jgi:hypothetical protein|tara:strand:+ start:1218 stop:1445 length:228 start_codon:yes stop_codon:yes gene_type:complete
MAKRISKKEKVLMYLQTYGTITPMDAYEMFQSMRLGAIIHTLRHEEPYYNIESKKEGKAGYARYTLKSGIYPDYE